MSDMEEINRKMAEQQQAVWWHKTMDVEEKFYYGPDGRWRLKCWWKARTTNPYAVHLFHPSGFLVETFFETSVKYIKRWIETHKKQWRSRL